MKIAIQKKGRLSDNSLELLKSAGYKIEKPNGKLRALSACGTLDVFFLRDDDIPEYVANGACDIGIVGQNVLLEKPVDVDTIRKLGFGKCRLSLAAAPEVNCNQISDLEGQDIATSYPVILKNYLEKAGVQANVHFLNGSVEIAPSMGLAPFVFDIVSTGATLKMNGLEEKMTLLQSEAVLVQSGSLNEEVAQNLEQLLFRIDAVQNARDFRYILLNAPNEKLEAIQNLIPGMNSPTITPLMREGWSSLHSVIPASQFWDSIASLKAEGAEGILVVAIEKMMP